MIEIWPIIKEQHGHFLLEEFFTAYCKVNDYSKEAVDLVDSLMRDMENHIKDQCLGSIAENFRW